MDFENLILNRLHGKAFLGIFSNLMEVFSFFTATKILMIVILIQLIFYLEMLQWWSEVRSDFSTDSKAFDSIIWNN